MVRQALSECGGDRRNTNIGNHLDRERRAEQKWPTINIGPNQTPRAKFESAILCKIIEERPMIVTIGTFSLPEPTVVPRTSFASMARAGHIEVWTGLFQRCDDEHVVEPQNLVGAVGHREKE